MELCNRDNFLAEQQEYLYQQIKVEEYSSCHHIWVKTFQDCDSYEGRRYSYYGCVKCGLDEMVIHLMERFNDLDFLELDQKLMYNFIRANDYYHDQGIYTSLFCNLDLAKAIYKKIKETHPDIDDDTAIKYLKVAFYNITKNEVSEERKVSRAKRLELKPNYFIKQ